MPGRIAAGAWWFGIVIIVSTYTANLAAFLTIKTPKGLIDSLSELSAQTKVKYSVVQDTEVENFFVSHQKSPYSKMAAQMKEWVSNEEVQWYENTQDALANLRNRTPDLAILTDAPIADYWKGQDCDNVRIFKNRFSNIGYGLALPLNSKFAEELSVKILNLREAGFIDQLDYKWITKTSTCVNKGSQVDSSGQQIELESMLGIFYVIYFGFAVAFVVLIIEWIASCIMSIDKDHPRKPKSFCEALSDKMYRLKVDFLENWFPFKLSNTEESYKLFAVRREISNRRHVGAWSNGVTGPKITEVKPAH